MEIDSKHMSAMMRWSLRIPTKPMGPMFITDESDQVVCVLDIQVGFGEPTWRKKIRNATLIASAPALVRALKYTVGILLSIPNEMRERLEIEVLDERIDLDETIRILECVEEV